MPQGILHNLKSDRRTTQGLFHIAEGGLPVPADKAAIPKHSFAALWAAALRPPQDLLTLPFTADQDEQMRCFVSLLLRPLVCPAAGGDPYLPENGAALDALHWTGTAAAWWWRPISSG